MAAKRSSSAAPPAKATLADPSSIERGQLVAVLFGTNGRVVDATYCGRVREFLAGLSARFGGRAGDQSPNMEITQPDQSVPAHWTRFRRSSAGLSKPSATQKDSDKNESTRSRPPALPKPPHVRGSVPKAAALLVSLGVPGGIAGLAGGAAVWFVMRRGKKRLQSQLEGLRNRRENPFRDDERSTRLHPPSPRPASSSGITTATCLTKLRALDHAWSVAHARVSERYPGAVPYLKIVEGVKDQLLSGVDEPQFS